jgi:hypothetical protein
LKPFGCGAAVVRFESKQNSVPLTDTVRRYIGPVGKCPVGLSRLLDAAEKGYLPAPDLARGFLARVKDPSFIELPQCLAAPAYQTEPQGFLNTVA